jgi:hypothetical protein
VQVEADPWLTAGAAEKKAMPATVERLAVEASASSSSGRQAVREKQRREMSFSAGPALRRDYFLREQHCGTHAT